jgi:hypothetical protein
MWSARSGGTASAVADEINGSGEIVPAGGFQGRLGAGGAAATPFTRGVPQLHTLNIDAKIVAWRILFG